MGDLPALAAARWGERVALRYGDELWTYRQFTADVDRVAKGLMALGIKPGDHVALWMTNRPEWLHLLYAVARVGGCLVPLNTRYRSDDLAFTVVNSQAKLLITVDRSGPIDYGDLLASARPEIEAAGHLELVVMMGGAGAALEQAGSTPTRRWTDLLAVGEGISDAALAERASAVSPDELMMLAYTSGTTGNPKGVMHSHRPLRNVRERALLLGHSRNDLHLNYLPLFHIYALSEIALMAILTGGCQKLYDAFDPDAVLDDIEQLGATTVHGFDAVWADLLDAQAGRARDVSSLRLGTLPAGASSPTPIARQVQDTFCPTISGYGMSESWAFIVCSHPTDTLEQRTETSGYPMLGVEIEIRDTESDEVLHPDVPGRLFVRHYTVTSGY
ncbi:MAG: long-chain fatty acid--CoA ligase, partial [Actinomycetota bacterium]|nr:long-chain fatty acid--CoA ligase [Actinomycetota bacterium]